MESLEEVLEHHGIKGMKWGVRKDPGHEGERARTGSIAKAEKKQVREIALANSGLFVEKFAKNHLEVNVNGNLERLNNSPKYRGKDVQNLKGQISKDYERDSKKTIQDGIAKSVHDYFGTTASGSYKAVYNRQDDLIHLQPIHNSAKHSNTPNIADFPSMTFKVQRNKLGQAVGVKHVPEVNSAEHSDSNDALNAILEHHGIKGMKWGVRKSSVTVASVGKPKSHHKKVSADAVEVHRHKQTVKTHGSQALSNAELKKLTERMNLETQLSSLSGKQKSIGEKAAREVLLNIGKQEATRLGILGLKTAGALAVGAAISAATGGAPKGKHRA